MDNQTHKRTAHTAPCGVCAVCKCSVGHDRNAWGDRKALIEQAKVVQLKRLNPTGVAYDNRSA